MNSTQIESWALRIIDIVKKGQPNEDFLVELKRDWIDKDKAARRIAGHANAARGENILWLIGVDDNSPDNFKSPRWNAGFSIITEANTNGEMRVSASASKNVRSIVTRYEGLLELVLLILLVGTLL